VDDAQAGTALARNRSVLTCCRNARSDHHGYQFPFAWLSRNATCCSERFEVWITRRVRRSVPLIFPAAALNTHSMRSVSCHTFCVAACGVVDRCCTASGCKAHPNVTSRVEPARLGGDRAADDENRGECNRDGDRAPATPLVRACLSSRCAAQLGAEHADRIVDHALPSSIRVRMNRRPRETRRRIVCSDSEASSASAA